MNCLLNCSKYSNAVPGFANSTCQCYFGYVWNSSPYRCEVNCSAIDYATSVSSDGQSCICDSHFDWKTNLCVIDCTQYPHSVNLTSLVACSCTGIYRWKDPTFGCLIDCFRVINSTGIAISNEECQCNTGYTWLRESCIVVQSKKSVSIGLIVGATVGGVAVLSAIAVIFWCCCCKALSQPPFNSVAISHGAPHTSNQFGPLKSSPNMQSGFNSLSTMRNMSKQAPPDQDVCSICLMGFMNATTNCRHRFHRECLKLWMAKDKTCPICRTPITEIQ